MFWKKQNDLSGLLQYHILVMFGDFVAYFENTYTNPSIPKELHMDNPLQAKRSSGQMCCISLPSTP